MSRLRFRRHLIAYSQSLVVLFLLAALIGYMAPASHAGAPNPTVRLAYVLHGNVWVLDEPSGERIQVTSDGTMPAHPGPGTATLSSSNVSLVAGS
jgi:hypothetical protein